LLTACPATTTIGVAFAAQELAVCPAEAHDAPLDWIITERETIRANC
jgi:5-formyltetrahydrofolate cyclo-ligase